MKRQVPHSRLKRRDDGCETLERLLRWPSLKRKFADKAVVIYSAQWLAWWRPNAHGYTDKLEDAGLWSIDQAINKTSHCGPEKQIRFMEAFPAK